MKTGPVRTTWKQSEKFAGIEYRKYQFTGGQPVLRTHTAILKVKPWEADHLCEVNLVFSLLEDDLTANSGNISQHHRHPNWISLHNAKKLKLSKLCPLWSTKALSGKFQKWIKILKHLLGEFSREMKGDLASLILESAQPEQWLQGGGGQSPTKAKADESKGHSHHLGGMSEAFCLLAFWRVRECCLHIRNVSRKLAKQKTGQSSTVMIGKGSAHSADSGWVLMGSC